MITENLIEKDKVYECDCMELMRVMAAQDFKVDCVITDPPYGINFSSHFRKEKFEVILNDNLGDEEFKKFLQDYFDGCYKILKEDSFLISFMGWSTIPKFNRAIKAAGFEIKSMPIWVKNNFGLGYYTRPQYEPMYLCLKGKPNPPETAISDVINCSRVPNLIHSCQKPVDLICKLLSTFTKKGDIVFDGFMGSFTTAVACHKLQRHFIGAEQDGKCYEVGKKRLKDFQSQISLFDVAS